jgi:hypothetical protein
MGRIQARCDEAEELIGVEGFPQQGDSLSTFFIDLLIHVQRGGHEDRGQVPFRSSRGLDEFDAVPPGHLKGRQQEVDILGRETIHRLLGIRCHVHAVALRSEEIRDVLADSFVVIDDEDAGPAVFRLGAGRKGLWYS